MLTVRRRPLPLSVLVGAPLALLLIGGGIGWFTRDTTTADRGGTAITVVGAPVPDDLDGFAPQQRMAPTPNPAVYDPASIIGLQPAGTIEVPAAAALELPLAAGGAAAVVDAVTHKPAAAAEQPERIVATPTPVASLPGLAAPASTTPLSTDPALAAEPTSTIAEPSFSDPCLTATVPCAGLPAVVRNPEDVADEVALAPLQISLPVSGAEGYAAQCADIQGDEVPDSALSPATRPTVVVLVNQPSTLALNGLWDDGGTIDKTTMVTSPADDAEWTRSWEQDRVQRNIVACLTLPLDDVRAHATAGVGELRADILAISATGRADITGEVTLNIPTDGDDDLFAERLVIADRGEQRRSDGVLYPTVHVHYAFVTDAVAVAASNLNPDDLKVYGQHAFIEDADCTGWAVNQTGRDRTIGSQFTVVSEQRSVAGRARNVTVVDGDVYLDPTMASGWEGQLCVRLIATDQPPGTPGAASPEPVTLALRGTTMRAPRTANYSVSVLVDPLDGAPTVSWATPAGVALCSDAELTSAEAGATCAFPARFAADGVWVIVGAADPLMSIRVPINTAYCNPDDPFGALADGCSRGYTQPLDIPTAEGERLRITLQVDRTAESGSLWQDPSHAWLVGPVTSFAS